MKMTSIVRLSAGVFSALVATVVAGQSDGSAKEKQFTGKVVFVNNVEHKVTVNGLLRHRTFDLGSDCSITRWDNATGALNDLRPGQEVIVNYQNVHGVLAADRVEQQALRYHGIVRSIDPAQRQLVLRHWDHDKKFILADDCKVLLHDQENAALGNIKPGDHVTVVYETPSGPDVAYQVAQTSVSFAGSVTAIDVPRRTVSLEGTFGHKQFSLANDCSIVMYGQIDASLANLRPGQHLTINYDEVNGVNVANRIAPAEGSHEATTAQANP
jgi:Cu/Ag efflux protein CusF